MIMPEKASPTNHIAQYSHDVRRTYILFPPSRNRRSGDVFCTSPAVRAAAAVDPADLPAIFREIRSISAAAAGFSLGRD